MELHAEPRAIIRLSKRRPNCCQHMAKDNSLLQQLYVCSVYQLRSYGSARWELVLGATVCWGRARVRAVQPS